jgi:transmembrane sensor
MDASRARGRRLRDLATGAIAAAALIAAAFAVPNVVGHPRSSSFGADEFVTGPSGVSTVTLRDGSVLRLGPRTRLTVTGRDMQREVRLDGRAFFAVAHMPEHPFRIITAAGTVTALGTRFDLQAQGDNLSVALLEGHVVVSTPGKELPLRAGQATRVVDGVPMPVSRIPDADRLLNWAGNFLAFQQTPLSDVAAELERHFDVHIEITDSSLANRTVTAWFADRTFDEVLRIVCAATLAECLNGGGGVIMRPAK